MYAVSFADIAQQRKDSKGRDRVSVDGVWFGNWIHCQLTDRYYK
jgi:hypothetical protein